MIDGTEVTVTRDGSQVALGEANSSDPARIQIQVPCRLESRGLRRMTVLDLAGFSVSFRVPGYRQVNLPLWQAAARTTFRAWWPWKPRPQLSVGCSVGWDDHCK